jgi:hypothetical protein
MFWINTEITGFTPKKKSGLNLLDGDKIKGQHHQPRPLPTGIPASREMPRQPELSTLSS